MWYQPTKLRASACPCWWPVAWNRLRALPGMVQRPRVVAPPSPQGGQVVVGAGLPGLVAGLSDWVQGVVQVRAGVFKAAQRGVGAGEAVGAGLRGRGDRRRPPRRGRWRSSRAWITALAAPNAVTGFVTRGSVW